MVFCVESQIMLVWLYNTFQVKDIFIQGTNAIVTSRPLDGEATVHQFKSLEYYCYYKQHLRLFSIPMTCSEIFSLLSLANLFIMALYATNGWIICCHSCVSKVIACVWCFSEATCPVQGCTTGSCHRRRTGQRFWFHQLFLKLMVAFFGDDIIKMNCLAYCNMYLYCMYRAGYIYYIPCYSHTTTGSLCIYISGTVIWIASICMSPCRILIWHITVWFAWRIHFISILCDLLDEFTSFYCEFSSRMSLYNKAPWKD